MRNCKKCGCLLNEDGECERCGNFHHPQPQKLAKVVPSESSQMQIDNELASEWQKLFVKKLIEQVGLTHSDAMRVMGIVCDIRQVAYMQGYDRGWNAATPT